MLVDLGVADLASYDFLGHPAVNIDMSNFDEFESDNLGDIQSKVSAAKTVSEPKVEAVGVAVKPESTRNLSLSLNDRSNMSMSVSRAGGEIFGTGLLPLEIRQSDLEPSE